MNERLSIVVPVKDEQANVAPLLDRIRAALDPTGRPFEIVVIDDGSTDGTHAELCRHAYNDNRIKVVRLRRNFGQTAALQAGIDFASGDVLVTMDGDLQNDPADIPLMVDKLNEGYDAVLGQRANRQDKLFVRKVPSLIANWIIRRVLHVPFKDFGCTLRAMRRDVAESLPLYGEMHRFVTVLAIQYGARVTQIPVRHHARTAGATKYGLSRTIRVILDLITVKFLDSYITRPMHFLGTAGLAFMGLGVVSLAATWLMKITGGTFMTGNPLLLLSVMFELIGMQCILMGLLGEVISRTYFESQGKSSYSVRDTVNVDESRRLAA
ncbi:MAG: glycosyltransferase family 2 protein [Gemmataceae bacterium]|nr:glycosyltransferase family 2 protein [Gemmataceae bacterium]